MATGTITEVKQKYNYVLQTHAIDFEGEANAL